MLAHMRLSQKPLRYSLKMSQMPGLNFQRNMIFYTLLEEQIVTAKKIKRDWKNLVGDMMTNSSVTILIRENSLEGSLKWLEITQFYPISNLEISKIFKKQQ